MSDLIELQQRQIEALQRELSKKDNCLQEAKKILKNLYHDMLADQGANFDTANEAQAEILTL